tara:strand:+ start:723 stop:1136 length:414 start_codon:yes stop_codon:yes gene_type:complete
MAYTTVRKAIGAAETAVTLTHQDQGVINVADLAADCVFTLPDAAAGLAFEFVYAGVTTDTADWSIDAGSDTNFMIGGLLWQIGAGAAEFLGPDGNSNSKLSIVVPEPGTRVEVYCDGTNWVVSGLVVAATTPAFADQ